MKSYSNRKYYNYKRKHKQRAKSERNPRWCKVDKELARIRQKIFRAQCKQILHQITFGKEIEFPLHLKSNDWDGC